MSVRSLFALAVATGCLAAPLAAPSAQSVSGPPARPPPSPSEDPRETPRDRLVPGNRFRQLIPSVRQDAPSAAALRAIVGPTCFRPGDLVMVEGRGLDRVNGYELVLALPGGPLALEVVAWQGTHLIARLGDDLQAVRGGRYPLILTDRRGQAIGQAPRIVLELCQAISQTGEPPGGQLADAAVPGEVTVLLSSGSDDPGPAIIQLGYGIEQREQLAALGQEILRLSVPPGTSVPQALDELRAALPEAVVDANSLYDLQAAPRLYARHAIGWPEGSFDCVGGGRGGRIGLIDGSLDMAHPALAGQDIVIRSFLRTDEIPASPDHGTGIAAQLVGNPDGGTEAGLLPAARLYVAQAFHQTGGTLTQASTFAVLSALNWLTGESLRVINLSFAGPPNSVLTAGLAQADRQGVIMIAASGNNGPEGPPAYPAADAPVIAVTAVDTGNRLYAKANQGGYIDFAAPGVDIWTAKAGEGGSYRSGTSFAAPYVAAVAAVELTLNPRLSAGLLKEGLRRGAVDLGPAGRDAQFGWGLVRAPAACRT